METKSSFDYFHHREIHRDYGELKQNCPQKIADDNELETKN